MGMGIIRHLAKTPPYLLFFQLTFIRSNGAYLYVVLVFLLERRQRKVHCSHRLFPSLSLIRSTPPVHPLFLDVG